MGARKSEKLFPALPEPLVNFGVLELQAARQGADLLRGPNRIFLELVLEDVSLLARQPEVAQSRSIWALAEVLVVISPQSFLMHLGCFLIELKVDFQIALDCCVFFTIARCLRRSALLMMSDRLRKLMKVQIHLRRRLLLRALAVFLEAQANHGVPCLLKLLNRVLERAD